MGKSQTTSIGGISSSESSSAPSHRAISKKRTRTKSGCLTCRIRRVKCDETKPSCHRCTSTGRTCSGFSDQPMSKMELIVAAGHSKSRLANNSSPPSAALSAPINGISTFPLLTQCHHPQPFVNETEKHYFDWFRLQTAPTTGLLFSTDFWERLVLQVTVLEPAIKHAVLAVGVLHKRFELRERIACAGEIQSQQQIEANAFAEELAVYAMSHYSKAVGYANKLLDDVKANLIDRNEHENKQRDAAFVACILFVCYENLAGNYAVASMHLKSGIGILSEAERQRDQMNEKYATSVADNGKGSPSNHTRLENNHTKTPFSNQRFITPAPSPTQVVISHLLRRLDLQCMTFSDSQDQYLYTNTSPIDALKQSEPAAIPQIFSHGDMTEASAALIDQFRWLFRIGSVLQGLSGSISEEQETPEQQEYDISASVDDTLPGPPRPDGIELEEFFKLLARSEYNLHKWQEAFERTRAHQSPTEYSYNQRMSTTLQIYHQVALLLLKAGCTGEEGTWDEHHTAIEHAVGLVDSLFSLLPSPVPASDGAHHNNSTSTTTFPPCSPNQAQPASLSLDIGLIFALFFMAAKCRDPKLRRRPLELMSHPACQKREGRWDSSGASAIIRRVIEIEENGAIDRLSGTNEGVNQGICLKSAKDIPEEARIYGIYITVNLEEREVEVKFVRKPDGRQWTSKTENIRF